VAVASTGSDGLALEPPVGWLQPGLLTTSRSRLPGGRPVLFDLHDPADLPVRYGLTAAECQTLANIARLETTNAPDDPRRTKCLPIRPLLTSLGSCQAMGERKG
jgi:hypothetical protein